MAADARPVPVGAISPAARPRVPSEKARKAAARQALTKQSRRWQGRVLRVKFRWLDGMGSEPAEAAPAARPVLTLAVAKKQARRAVDRNRVKRLVREWFRGPATTAKPADLLVGLHRPWARHTSEPDLLADLADLVGVLAGQRPSFDRDRPRDARGKGKGPGALKGLSAPTPPPPALPSPPVPPAA